MDSPFFCLIEVTTSIMAHIYDADIKSGRVHFISREIVPSIVRVPGAGEGAVPSNQ